MITFDEWVAERVGKFTASEISRLMAKGRNGEYFGQSAKKYIRERAAEILTCERIGGKFNSDAMEWGNAHEEEAATRFQNEIGLQFTYYGVFNPKFFEYTDFSGGSPDGVGEDFILEIKCPYNSGGHIEHMLIADTEGLADYAPEYYWQMLMNMLCCKKERGYFISYDPRFALAKHQIKILEIKPLDGDMELLKERIKEAEKEISVIIGLINY